MSFFRTLFKSKKNNNKTASKATPTQTPAAQPALVNLGELNGAELFTALLTHTDAPACLTALERLTDSADFVTLASQHPVAAVRFAAAQKLTQAADIQQLLNASKGRDKNVYRWCREQVQAQRTEQAEHQAQLERIEYLHSQLNYLIKLGYHPEFSGKLQLIKQEWPTLSALAEPSMQTQMQQLLAECDALLAEFTAEEAAQRALEQAQQEAQRTQERALENSEQLLQNASTLSVQELQPQVADLQQQWRSAFQQFKPSAEASTAFEQHMQALLMMQGCLEQHQEREAEFAAWLAAKEASFKQGQQWLQAFAWPTAYPSPAWLTELYQKIDRLNAQHKQQQQQQKQQLGDLESTLAALQKALKQGQIKEANKYNQQAIQAFKQLPAQATQALRAQQQSLYAQLQELRDWAGFATLPKKEALVAEMTALIGSELAPDALAEKIQRLQEEWKALSNTGLRDQELWQQFSQAADQAFEPCKAYFAEQAELRQQLTQQRQQLINELEHYEQAMDWTQADWPVVQKTLDAARQTFRTLGPIERQAHQKTQQQFNQVCDRIFEHLQQEYSANLTRKEALVAEAQQLAAAEDLKGVVDKIKALQQHWQAVGVTPRGPDQKLWKQFRSQCDAVFSRLNEQREERKAEINENVTAAEQQVAEALASENSASIKQALQSLQSFSLPKTTFQALSQQLQQALAQQQQAQKQQAFAGLLARLEQLHGNEEQWQQACALPLPAGFQAEQFEQARLATSEAHEGTEAESAENLCLLLEIVTEQPSPETQQAQRMELQVQRLAEGLGKGVTKEEEIQQLIMRWLKAQPNAELKERFLHTLKSGL